MLRSWFPQLRKHLSGGTSRSRPGARKPHPVRPDLELLEKRDLPSGMHPTNVKLPAMFPVTDEIYYTSKFNPDNVVVLRCGSDKRAISWVRQQGSGRVFYTTLGHDNHSWTMPPLVDDHVIPGLLWTIGR